ncbi:MAG: inositol monophosphatase family protein, partial [Myxococcaceae bacterium]
MSEARSWMEAAEAVARVAGGVALRHYHRGVVVETKGDGTPVSVADREAEEAARRWLETHCPEDGILGEEL